MRRCYTVIRGLSRLFERGIRAFRRRTRARPIPANFRPSARLITVFRGNSITRRIRVCDRRRVCQQRSDIKGEIPAREDVEMAQDEASSRGLALRRASSSPLPLAACRAAGTNEETLPLVRGITMRPCGTGRGKLNIRPGGKKVIVSEYIFRGARRGTHSCLRSVPRRGR